MTGVSQDKDETGGGGGGDVVLTGGMEEVVGAATSSNIPGGASRARIGRFSSTTRELALAV